MCGRLAVYSSPQDFATLLGASSEITFTPSYNIPPSHFIPACRVDAQGERELVLLHWGLIPHWSKGPDSRFSMFNARAESVHEKPAFRSAFKRQRCLIPVDGFYEWAPANGKQPYFIHRRDDTPLVFAGLWEHWTGENGDVIESCTIIVGEASASLQAIHERMPVMLDPQQYAIWLDPNNEAVASLRAMLQPRASEEIEAYPVSRSVNSPSNDSPDLIERVA